MYQSADHLPARHRECRFGWYPRTEEADAAKLAPLGAHVLYAPDVGEMYPNAFATTVTVSGVMARDLDIPISIVPCPTVREPDGLALSSRNVRLSPASVLVDAAAQITGGAPVDETTRQSALGTVAAGYTKVEYLELRADEDLTPMSSLDKPARLLAAAWLGETGLIDNVKVPFGQEARGS